MSDTVAPGKKTSQQLRVELFGEILKFTPLELEDLALEAEGIYNSLAEGGHPPSEVFAKLIVFLSREATVLTHPERDEEWACRNCGKS
jgi:hypothetical protein